jgi:hypothetical protein
MWGHDHLQQAYAGGPDLMRASREMELVVLKILILSKGLRRRSLGARRHWMNLALTVLVQLTFPT